MSGDGSVQINNAYTLPTSDGTAGQVQVTDGSGNVSWQNAGVPIGTIQMWATPTPPDGWLICDGTNVGTGTYPALEAVLGGTVLPNFNGRFPLGVGNSNTQYSSNHNLKSTGGFEKHQLSEAEMPSHNHDVTVTYREGSENGSGNNYSDLGGGSSSSKTFTSNTKGNDSPHNNMPPFYTIYFIIKAE